MDLSAATLLILSLMNSDSPRHEDEHNNPFIDSKAADLIVIGHKSRGHTYLGGIYFWCLQLFDHYTLRPSASLSITIATKTRFSSRVLVEKVWMVNEMMEMDDGVEEVPTFDPEELLQKFCAT
jgi:hypothetical protein